MGLLKRICGELRKRAAGVSAGRAEARLRVVSRTRGTVLATQLEVADTGARRRKGLLGRAGLPPGGGLWIVPCESVHTFFMRFAIDLVYLDRNRRVRKLRSGVGPRRLSICLRAHSVMELPAGTICTARIARGDVLEFEPAAAPGEMAE